jgi:hypothetical protein
MQYDDRPVILAILCWAWGLQSGQHVRNKRTAGIAHTEAVLFQESNCNEWRRDGDEYQAMAIGKALDNLIKQAQS